MTPTVGLIFILIEWPLRASLASHALSDTPRVSADKRDKHDAESSAKAEARSAQLVDYADVRPLTTTWAIQIVTCACACINRAPHTTSLILTHVIPHPVPGNTVLTTMIPGLYFIQRMLSPPPGHPPVFTSDALPVPHVFYFSGELK